MNTKSSNKKSVVYYVITILVLILLLVSLYISNKERADVNTPISDTQFALNTIVTITLYDSNDPTILEEAFQLCNHYEKIFSRTLPTSELYKINRSDKLSFQISDDLASLIRSGIQYSSLSNGSFDISIAPVSELWDFTAEKPIVPPKNSIKERLPFVGYQNFNLSGNTLTKTSTSDELDLGAIAKGYIADRIKDYLVSQNVHSALINLGGNILCVGNKEGEPFHIGIQAPFKDRNVTLANLSITDKSIVTSGIYERCFTQDGVLYHHILNPKTGYPYENDLSSVTIISDLSTDGDALSTTCFSLGLEKGMKYINEHPDIDAIFVSEEGEIHFSKGLQKKYHVTEE